jgi:Ca2+/Na+ antiporter
MSKDQLFQISSAGIFFIALIVFNYGDPLSLSNLSSLFLIAISVLFLFLPKRINSVNIKNRNLILKVLIVFLLCFLLVNIILVLYNPSNLKFYGWILVSVCFITFYFLIIKENKKDKQK